MVKHVEAGHQVKAAGGEGHGLNRGAQQPLDTALAGQLECLPLDIYSADPAPAAEPGRGATRPAAGIEDLWPPRFRPEESLQQTLGDASHSDVPPVALLLV